MWSEHDSSVLIGLLVLFFYDSSFILRTARMEVKEVIRKACHTLMPRLQTFLRFRKVSGKQDSIVRLRLGFVGMQ